MFNKIFKLTLAIVAISFVAFNVLFLRVTIESDSMKPTLAEGDVLLLRRTLFNSDIERGDLILFSAPSKENVLKRVIGVAGDLITLNEKTVYITKSGTSTLTQMKNTVVSHGEHDQDGYPLSVYETQIDNIKFNVAYTGVIPTYESRYYRQENLPLGQWSVPEGAVFVMGDNRDFSVDSRFLGFIDSSRINGIIKN